MLLNVDSRDYVLGGIYYSVLVLVYTPSNMTSTKCSSNAGPPSAMLAQLQTSTDSTAHAHWAALNPVGTKHLYNIFIML